MSNISEFSLTKLVSGIKKKEFVDLSPSLLMKGIGGLFHQLLISNDEVLKDDEFEIMLRNFLKPKNG